MLGAFLKAIPFVFGSLFMGSEYDYLTYEQFGAKGDGVTDDLPAIIATHEAANEKGLPVRADDGKTYYIGNTVGTAVVRTDIDFGTAKFIIDDSNVSLENREHYIFKVESALKPIEIKGVGSLKRDQTNIGVTLPGRCLVRVVNNNHKAYIRLGANQDNGTAQEEYFIADKDGNIAEVCIGTGQKNSREHYLNRPRSNGDPHGQMAMMWLCCTLLK